MATRIGAVSFLNARPLVWGLERDQRFAIRYDVPSRCASLLHEGAIDVGLVPSVEYLAGDYSIVPGVGVVSDGAVASVAIFTRVPIDRVRSIALDTSSRTSVALVRVLCANHFDIAPEFVSAPPELETMLERCDAGLLIGEPALFAAHERLGVEKIDLGEAWKAMTGLPFVYAFWAGRADALDADRATRLQHARDDGRREIERVADAFFPGDPVRREEGVRYLRDHVLHVIGDREQAGLERFLALAAETGAAPPAKAIRYFETHRWSVTR
jgi:chorismate dehydratase